MATSQQLRHASLLLAAATLAVLFIGSAQANSGCPSGFKDCNPRVAGCETCISSDVNNCGGCGQKCKNLAYTVPKCSNGQCKYTCKAGWANCDNDLWKNGCEKDLRSDAKNCGKCGNCCKQVANAVTKCANGKCGEPVCNTGFGNCDNDLWKNGCEKDLRSDAKNCGKCGNCCKQVANAVTKCANGKCGEPVCNTGFGNCDNDLWKNGCEKDLRSDAKNCGKCGNCCKLTLANGEVFCSNGQCGQRCKSGWTFDNTKKCCVPIY